MINFKPPILITDEARKGFWNFLQEKGKNHFFLIGVLQNRGCSGNKYYIRPTNNAQLSKELHDIFLYDHHDKKYLPFAELSANSNIITFAIDKFSLFKIIGSTIDFSVNNRLSKGFFFTNPNETGRCGCGESFST